MKVAIAGAGIGGLTLALMLHKCGIEAEIWEAATEIKPLGVGINLLPHAAQQLSCLGLEELLAGSGIETSALAYFNRFGQQIWREARGRAAGYDYPQFSIHRGELQMILLNAAVARLGAERIHSGYAFKSFTQSPDKVNFTVERRYDGVLIEAEADILVGGDGIHSALRRCLYPSGDAPVFSGRMLWRAITEAAPFLDGKSMFMAGHQDQKFVCYPISEPLRRQGRSMINWIAELRVPEGVLAATDWNRKVDKSAFADHFSDWRWDWIDIPAIIDGAGEIFEFPLVDRNPLPKWSFGRVTLMGDAAHPMYPIGSNGSAQAILDASYLCDCLQQESNPLQALLEYEAERLPRTTGIVLRNRMNGPEQVMQMAEERAPQGFKHISDILSCQQLEHISMRYKRLAGFDKDSVKTAA